MDIKEFHKKHQDSARNLIDRIVSEELDEEYIQLADEDINNLSGAYQGEKDALLVGFDSDELVGLIGIKEETEDSALIRRICVHEGYRHLGLGSMLLHRGIDFCRIKGYKKVIFRGTDRMKPAVGLMLKNGFKEKEESLLEGRNIVELELNL